MCWKRGLMIDSTVKPLLDQDAVTRIRRCQDAGNKEVWQLLRERGEEGRKWIGGGKAGGLSIHGLESHGL